ncbi:MAG: URC4/urg3 family protein [Tatlockia sp.]|nr:URC4/urg3 family protein [Tatlockia sp.]
MNEKNNLDLQSLKTIRIQSNKLLTQARHGLSRYFFIKEERMPALADYVIEVIGSQYPNHEIPYHSRWRHFEAGGINRIKELNLPVDSEESGKILYELVIISVLLDAGAGNQWRFKESRTSQTYSRSEGLALASLELYLSGVFSAIPKQPLRVDTRPLIAFSETELKKAFQVSEYNPLEGVDGRVALMNRLGKVVQEEINFREDKRLGNFYSYIIGLQRNDEIALSSIFKAVEHAFRRVWPQRKQHKGLSLGDVWSHPSLEPELIPFHKLSQWLTYSLIEPLENANIKVTDLDELTALPEYRNGGLLIDMGLLELKNPQHLTELHSPDSELIVEWRALTVALLDELADAIRQKLKKNAATLPLAKILQGGTWEAGRRIAKEKRSDGRPPIQILSDGTVF